MGTKVGEGLMYLDKVIGKIQGLLAGCGEHSHPVTGMERSLEKPIRRIAGARQTLERRVDVVEVKSHEAARQGDYWRRLFGAWSGRSGFLGGIHRGGLS